MARVYTKIGDIFSVKIDCDNTQYFQYVANDLTQLNSSVIRVFEKWYSPNEIVDLTEVIQGEIAFYAHSIINLGVKLGYWEKVGKAQNVYPIDVLFRNTNDYGSAPGEQVEISDNWYVWKINDADFTQVGKLKNEYRNAEIGIVISPDSIVHRMRTGKYDFVYPNYE